MGEVSQVVKGEVAQRFSTGQSAVVVDILATTALPFLETPDRERDRQRVQLAALKYANGDLRRLREAMELARIDWRDLLMATGLGGENWRAVLSEAGFAVPE